MRKKAKLGCLFLAVLGLFILIGPGSRIGAQEQLLPRPGLKLEILEVAIPEATRRPEVTFHITDERNTPLDKDGVLTEGAVSARFLIATINAGERQYTSYIVRQATGQVSGTVDQATTDSGGTYTAVGAGTYTYQYGTVLPEDYDRAATHTVGVYASRNYSHVDGNTYVASATHDFVPNGNEVTVKRDVVTDAACNRCHNQLTLHGSRRGVALCILCHNPQTVDPDTGNTVDFNVMVHKIHRGFDLPSVRAGTPYQIVGCCGSTHDYSTVRLPQDIRNCGTCHTGTQGGNYATEPSRAACGSCHDNLDFATGENHYGIIQVNDNACRYCHRPDAYLDFDLSVEGAHVIPGKSRQLPGVNYEIVSVENTNPGENLSVVFNIKDNAGNVIEPMQMSSLSLNYAGPATDYASNYIEDARMSVAEGNGNFRYTFSLPIPADASGTYTVGIEGRRNVQIMGPDGPFTVRDSGTNVTKPFAVTGEPAARRVVVDVAKCNACHDSLRHHGSRRVDNPQYCVLCHNPNLIDPRPPNGLPAQSVHFKFMIHRIHTGEELTQDYFVGNTNFNDERFPGRLRDCVTCHVPGTQLIGSTTGRLPTVNPSYPINPIPPISAACVGCHDSEETSIHVQLNTASFGESCAVCHGEGREFSVSKVHLSRSDAR